MSAGHYAENVGDFLPVTKLFRGDTMLPPRHQARETRCCLHKFAHTLNLSVCV